MTPSHAGNPLIDAGIQLPSTQEIVEVLSFQAGYNTSIVVTGALFLGIAAGLVGAFTLLRKRSLMGDALAHSALPGVAGMYIVLTLVSNGEKDLPLLLLGATLSGVCGVLAVQAIVRWTRLSEDTAIGAVLSVFFGIGIVLLSIVQYLGSGASAGLSSFIYGQTAAMQLSDAYLTIGGTLVSLLVLLLLAKELTLMSFDQEFAEVQGWPITILDLTMMSLVVLVTVIGLQAVGLILIVALLIIPPTAARFWSERLKVMLVLSALIGGGSAYLGASLSALLPRLPAGSVIVLTAATLFGFSFLFAPKRGVLANLIRRVFLQVRIEKDHILREIYEHHETRAQQLDSPFEAREIFYIRKLSPLKKWISLFLLLLFGYLHRGKEHYCLTEAGMQESRRLTRNHRLWEEYLLVYAHLSSSHVDYSADLVEHVLSPELVQTLEASLATRGVLPATSPGESVHPI